MTKTKMKRLPFPYFRQNLGLWVRFAVIIICVLLLIYVVTILGFIPAISRFSREANVSAKPLETIRVGQTIGPLRVNSIQPRYFMDGNGRVVYLTGSHTWSNFMDSGTTDPPVVFDYAAFLDFLQTNNHNFFRLWRAENVEGGETGDTYWFSPMPYLRMGPETALDGKAKFELTQFNQAYFDRIRSRIIEAGQRGIYVSIMLFDGWSVESKLLGHNPWPGHPFNKDNNENGVNGDTNGNGSGEETHTLQIPEITALQEAYVQKVIDTVNDLDNVLYEISNESPGNSQEWQYHMINFIKSYEAAKSKQHPVGMTVEYPGGDNAELWASPADWISLSGDVNNPSVTDGSKVIMNDTDHLCGLCGDRQWVWKSFTRGINPIFMDPYDGASTGRGAPTGYDPNNANDASIRKNMGYALTYANRMNLTVMTPRNDLCSTGYCLVNSTTSEAEYLVYLPADVSSISVILKKIGFQDLDQIIHLPSILESNGNTVTVDLTTTTVDLAVEWLDPSTGMISVGGKTTGGAVRTFTAPFKGDAVLYLSPTLHPSQ